MVDFSNIHEIGCHNPKAAISLLCEVELRGEADDKVYYVMGRLYWRLGHHAEAVNCYRRALELNPESDARHALERATQVFDFFNPDLLNP